MSEHHGRGDLSERITFPDPPRHRWLWVVGAVVVLAVLAVVLVPRLTTSTRTQAADPATSPTSSASTTTDPGAGATSAPTSVVPGVSNSVAPTALSSTSAAGQVVLSDVLTVGQDIGPGVYRSTATTAGGTCIWQLVSGTGNDVDSIQQSGVVNAQAVVDVLSSSVQLRSFGCTPWLPVTTPKISSSFGPGDILVNTDILPGTYVANDPEEGCSWERTARMVNQNPMIIDFGQAERAGEPIQVQIMGNDFVFRSSSCGTWTLAR